MPNSSPPAVLSVAIVLFRSAPEQVRAMLESLLAAIDNACAAGLLDECDIMLRDHSADPGYATGIEALLAAFTVSPAVTISYDASGDNAGFGAGHNRLLREARGGFALVLNPDVELAADALSGGLCCMAENAGAVLVTPAGFDAAGRPLHLSKRYPSVAALLLRAVLPSALQRVARRYLSHYEMHDLDDSSRSTPVPLASGCCMLLRRDAFEVVGGFDETYFLYFEDFDLSLRLAGQGDVVYCPRMRILHHGGKAGRKGPAHILMFLRSGIRFFRSYGWRWV